MAIVAGVGSNLRAQSLREIIFRAGRINQDAARANFHTEGPLRGFVLEQLPSSLCLCRIGLIRLIALRRPFFHLHLVVVAGRAADWTHESAVPGSLTVHVNRPGGNGAHRSLWNPGDSP